MDTPKFKTGYKPNEIAYDSLKEMITQSLMTALPQAINEVIKSRTDLHGAIRDVNSCRTPNDGKHGVNENAVELLFLKIDNLTNQFTQLTTCVAQSNDRAAMTDPIYTMEEALKILDMSYDTFRRRVKAGKLKCKKDGEKVYLRQSDIEAYWAGLEYLK
ncbi:helix-turn-helix domain-containing protein [Parabacteroides sp. FAFU027]|uniref:helix-turn-helix domain-containing protein n=1 Tax=Parabacteroides sp. FAFU027 TaxID=2922715 RepID=UPI001FAF54F8|nr:helix-turn-helix domain-containing protein [Parabacteroides sp. FAFU027]